MTQLVKRKDVAAFFGVDPKTVQRWEKKNLIKPHSHLNGRPLYKREEVERLANEGTSKLQSNK